MKKKERESFRDTLEEFKYGCEDLQTIFLSNHKAHPFCVHTHTHAEFSAPIRDAAHGRSLSSSQSQSPSELNWPALAVGT